MSLDRGDGPGKIFPGLDSLVSQSRASQPREQSNGPKQPIAQLFEQGTYSTLIIFLRTEF
jgi:kinesin family member 5